MGHGAAARAHRPGVHRDARAREAGTRPGRDPRPRPARALSGRLAHGWARLFAALYDLNFGRIERAGLAARRQRLLAAASGTVIEIGAGTGLNLGHYGHAVDRLVLVEPEEPMARRLDAKVAGSARAVEVVRAPAGALPFEDATFDTAVCTLVLCTVPDQAEALAEIRRVLRPGGQLLFIEHVRADDERLARWQDRLDRPWRFLCAGCHPNRDTEAAIAAAGFGFERLAHGRLEKVSALARPSIEGVAAVPRA